MYIFEENIIIGKSTEKIDIPLLLAHVFYRNGIIEEYHNELVILNKKVWRAILSDVTNRIYSFMVLRNDFLQVSKLKDDRLLYQHRYYFLLAYDQFYGKDWDKALDISSEVESYIKDNISDYDKNAYFNSDSYHKCIGVAAYLLGGEFQKAFEDRIVLDNEAMKKINKDIHNRCLVLFNWVKNDNEDKLMRLIATYMGKCNYSPSQKIIEL